MRSTFIVVTVTLVAMVLSGSQVTPNAHAGVGPIPLNCDRVCLEDLIEQYINI